MLRVAFRAAKNHTDETVKLNRAGEDVTKLFHIAIHRGGVIQFQFKKTPSHKEWKAIAGNRTKR